MLVVPSSSVPSPVSLVMLSWTLSNGPHSTVLVEDMDTLTPANLTSLEDFSAFLLAGESSSAPPLPPHVPLRFPPSGHHGPRVSPTYGLPRPLNPGPTMGLSSIELHHGLARHALLAHQTPHGLPLGWPSSVGPKAHLSSSVICYHPFYWAFNLCFLPPHHQTTTHTHFYLYSTFSYTTHFCEPRPPHLLHLSPSHHPYNPPCNSSHSSPCFPCCPHSHPPPTTPSPTQNTCPTHNLAISTHTSMGAPACPHHTLALTHHILATT